MKRKSALILVAAVLALSASASFGNTSPQKAGLEIKDSLDRTVSIPARVERIVSIQPEISRLIVALGAGDNLVGVDYTLQLHDPMFRIIYPKEHKLALVSMAENNINLEMTMRLKPDIIFVSPYERQIVRALEGKTRIPVVALASMGSFATLCEEMRLVGRALGRGNRADELVAYFNEGVHRVRKSLQAVPEQKKPRVYLSFWGSLTRTPVLYEPVDAAGGINVAEKIAPDILGSVSTKVNVEQIIRWNPDIILVHGHYPPRERTMTVDQVLADSRLAAVEAVRSKKVFYTLGFWDWWDMAEVMIETHYLARLFYPDRFAGFDLIREGNAIFKKFYGIEAGFSELCRILKCDEWTHE